MMRTTVAFVSALALSLGLAAPSPAVAQTQPIQAYLPGAGISYPVLLREVQPKYTPEALQAGLSGEVELEAVVLTDGTVADVRIKKSLDRTLGLDEAAIAAARQWLFKPGMKDGVPVATIVRIVLQYRFPPGSGSGSIVMSAPQAAVDEFTVGTVAASVPGLQKPTVVRSVTPSYTRDAMRARIQGTVEVQVVVLPDGTVGRARVMRSLDSALGLDQQAIEAVKHWTFTPGTLNGKTVPVVVTVVLEFKLH